MMIFLKIGYNVAKKCEVSPIKSATDSGNPCYARGRNDEKKGALRSTKMMKK